MTENDEANIKRSADKWKAGGGRLEKLGEEEDEGGWR